MILAFDTYYYNNKAKTVCVAFEDWGDTRDLKTYSEIREDVEEYTPGEFYKRELPCILSLLRQITGNDIEAIIVDGFVYLDDDAKLGLGGHLYHHLGCTIPIIGVAKSNFATLDKNKVALQRGESERPLFITAAGMDPKVAADRIKSMSGSYRIPALLKALDRLTKENILPQ